MSKTSPKAHKNNVGILGYVQDHAFAVGVAGAAIFIGILLIPIPSTSTELISIPYTTQQVQDSNVELGDTQSRQPGTNGQGLERHKVVKPLLSYILGLKNDYSSSSLPTQTTQAPINEIVAQGTKRYQYMLCSNGGYTYFTNEQLQNPKIGFTHKSPDSCAAKGYGHTTGLSDTAPQQAAQNTYVPYTSSLHLPTYTTCHQYTYINDFSCTTY
jgi:hypothetical protein